MEKIYGKGIYEGVVIGKPFLKYEKKIEIESYSLEDEDIEKEILRYKEGIKFAQSKLSKLINDLKSKVDKKDLQILIVHFEILNDSVILKEIEDMIRKEKINVEEVVKKVLGKYIDLFSKKTNLLYQQRASDLKDIRDRLLFALIRRKELYNNVEGKILIAKEILPSELLELVNNHVEIKGIIMEFSGTTSHVAILAKSLEIPTFMGGKDLFSEKWSDKIILDTYHLKARVINNPIPEVIREYKKLQKFIKKEDEEIQKNIDMPSITLDGVKINLDFNADQNIDLNVLKKTNPRGIGLLRTEFIYMERNNLPTEQEQVDIYNKISQEIGNEKPIIIRTLDIGADKKLSYCPMDAEENPSLGERGIRFTLRRKRILRTQLRAILRSAYGKKIKIMHPMISSRSEILKIKQILDEVKEELRSEGLNFKEDIETGIMVEVPSVIFMARELAEEIDFFSIGTNDLAQYILAADRFSQKENELYDYYHPAVLRGINILAEVGREKNKNVSVCGEMGGELVGIVILLSFGIKDLSMAKTFIPRARNIVRKIKFNDLGELKHKILNCRDSDEVKKTVKSFIEKL
ncbi:phosphoenolpyruvate--protein phosphotransferase [Fusobacterium sp. IOR10]|uniref:phosphoenolpyruvate--protein phosphotransferase n=1 Tax=Fusobacterium sp. IOR10 TaxID=2665157 RepID=UPI0013D59690|nr:phosphoenolpyruvate--protein phosphotransferase [Fusobacterium sp. IOR10]